MFHGPIKPHIKYKFHTIVYPLSLSVRLRFSTVNHVPIYISHHRHIEHAQAMFPPVGHTQRHGVVVTERVHALAGTQDVDHQVVHEPPQIFPLRQLFEKIKGQVCTLTYTYLPKNPPQKRIPRGHALEANFHQSCIGDARPRSPLQSARSPDHSPQNHQSCPVTRNPRPDPLALHQRIPPSCLVLMI